MYGTLIFSGNRNSRANPIVIKTFPCSNMLLFVTISHFYSSVIFTGKSWSLALEFCTVWGSNIFIAVASIFA